MTRLARRIGIFFRLDTPFPVRLWAGIGDQRIPTSPVEPDPANLYLGVGDLVGIPTVNQLVNGVAQRVDFSLSGDAVTAEAVGIADNEADDIAQVEARLGIRRFGEDDQGVGPVLWLWHGLADSLVVAGQSAGGGAFSHAVSLSVATRFSFRQRNRGAYWTDIDQRRRSADDAFCDRVAGYSEETGKVWKTT